MQMATFLLVRFSFSATFTLNSFTFFIILLCICSKCFTVTCFSVPQQGEILITTEFGKMMVEPTEICVIQVFV